MALDLKKTRLFLELIVPEGPMGTRNISVYNITLPRPSLSKYYLIYFSEEKAPLEKTPTASKGLAPENCITVVIREGVLIYLGFCGINHGLERLESVSWEENLLETEFPYGKVGCENRILFFMDRKNHFRKVYNTSLVVRILYSVYQCFPMLSGFGRDSSS